eukprot:3921182-Amphidinium_carterae.1
MRFPQFCFAVYASNRSWDRAWGEGTPRAALAEALVCTNITKKLRTVSSATSNQCLMAAHAKY